jgi:hypothetical protein
MSLVFCALRVYAAWTIGKTLADDVEALRVSCPRCGARKNQWCFMPK